MNENDKPEYAVRRETGETRIDPQTVFGAANAVAAVVGAAAAAKVAFGNKGAEQTPPPADPPPSKPSE